MDLQETKDLLNKCVRNELRDHAFGDAEVFWELDGEEVAYGTFGGTNNMVELNREGPAAGWIGQSADELRKCGIPGQITRIDEMGGDKYVEGQCMPALTLEGVREELVWDTSKHQGQQADDRRPVV